MGKVTAKVKLRNHADEVAVELGVKKPEEVRSVEVEALIDTGATTVLLPKPLAEKLGLETVEYVPVRYANGRTEHKPVVRDLSVEIVGRSMETRAVVEESYDQVLVGQFVLEVLDLVIDPKRGTLGPRQESPDSPLWEFLHLSW